MQKRDEAKTQDSSANISLMGVSYKKFKDALNSFKDDKCTHRVEMLIKDLTKYIE